MFFIFSFSCSGGFRDLTSFALFWFWTVLAGGSVSRLGERIGGKGKAQCSNAAPDLASRGGWSIGYSGTCTPGLRLMAQIRLNLAACGYDVSGLRYSQSRPVERNGQR
ncbi:hypothetical protein BD289DRAFT_96436 [Coniella lustricola]|uniref:Uncharacterized protein n=1 Tax=Coniella lustricola TaxID=2025994 RepID=A0A2T3AMX0_9PEZI|nr:hypothetical protein BD289DRAFT_96436 [Coniella lustricola]